ncbi:MAG: hypothetical protein AABZ30_01540 [Myxococcota bacterium]
MAFAHGPEAHHEPPVAGWEVALVGREHHRRVEQRGGLDRVLVREIRADQQAPFATELGARGDVVRDSLEVPLEDLFEPFVARREVRHDARKRRGYLRLRELEDPLHEQFRPRLTAAHDLFARQKRLGDDAAGIGQQGACGSRDRQP